MQEPFVGDMIIRKSSPTIATLAHPSVECSCTSHASQKRHGGVLPATFRPQCDRLGARILS
jgi:hypothetical protein